MTVQNGNQEWAITVNGEEVVKLFDRHESETLNPLEATDAQTNSGWIDIEPGDVIAFERVT